MLFSHYRFWLTWILLCFPLLSAAQEATIGEAAESEATAEADDAPAPAPGETGVMSITVFDRDDGSFVGGATVIIEDQSNPASEPIIRVTNSRGEAIVRDIPVGVYRLTFSESSYATATLSSQQVVAGEVARVSFELVEASEGTDNIFSLPAFDVEVEELEQRAVDIINIRKDAQGALEFLDTADFARFGVSDIAGAIGKIPGINVVGGQFATIRGLSERYNSTEINGVPVPSPDPIRQSVQLDLFPTAAVERLVVQKSFLPEFPGNASGGAIEILTREFPEQFEAKVGASLKYNFNAQEVFLRDQNNFFRDLMGRGFDERNPLGFGLILQPEDAGGGVLSDPPQALSLSFSMGDTVQVWDRDLSIVTAVNYSSNADTALGFQEDRVGTPSTVLATVPGSLPPGLELAPFLGTGTLLFNPLTSSLGTAEQFSQAFISSSLTENGVQDIDGNSFTDYAGNPFDDLRLPGSELRFDLTESTIEARISALLSLGFNLDKEGNHTVSFVGLGTRSGTSIVQRRNNGFLPAGRITSEAFGGDLVPNSAIGGFEATGDPGSPFFIKGIVEFVDPGAFLAGEGIPDFLLGTANELDPNDEYTAAEDFTSYEERRFGSLQLVGDHVFTQAQDLRVDWVIANSEVSSNTRQTEFNYFENQTDGTFFALPFLPTGAEIDQVPFTTLINERLITEDQDFIDVSVTYPLDQGWWIDGDVRVGFAIEESARNVEQTLLPFNIDDDALNFLYFTPVDLARAVAGQAVAVSPFITDAFSESERQVTAWYASKEFEINRYLRVVTGARFEQIQIDTAGVGVFSNGVPFQNFLATNFGQFGGATGAELLGIEGDFNNIGTDPGVGQDAIVGTINEEFILPAISIIVSPTTKFNVRFGYSETVARPSFRELSPYVSRDIDSADDIVGNPALRLSRVTNKDVRFEYVFDNGDLFAVSLFEKIVENPIEQVRLPGVPDGSFLSFINNPNNADIRGIEIEARKNLGDIIEGLDNFSLGGNATFIDATVKNDPLLLQGFGFSDTTTLQFINAAGDLDTIEVGTTGTTNAATALGPNGLELAPFEERRLFDQPKRILNFDLSYANPDSGWSGTIAYSNVSDVLTAAGTGLSTSGAVPDTFTGPFFTVDIILSKTFDSGWSFTFEIDNVTNSRRTLIYDSEISGTVRQEFRVGRSVSFGVDYTF